MSERQSITALAKDLAFFALEVLRDNDGTMALADLMGIIAKKKGASIPAYAMSKYPNRRDTRSQWEVNVQFECDKFVKAAFLRKKRGVWHLTAEGEKALKGGKKHVVDTAIRAVRTYKEKQQRARDDKNAKLLSSVQGASDNAQTDTSAVGALDVDVDSHMDNAVGEITDYIRNMEPYEFQDLCAALLRGMNFHVREVAPPGPDGGIDIIAYTDPLGSHPPRLKVQVKHQEAKTPTDVLTQLTGRLTDGDIGILISSGGFVAGCRVFARGSNRHLELIDLPRLIELWLEHYGNLSEEDKALLPLQSIYFLDKRRAAQE